MARAVVREPRQARSRETLERFFAAAEELFARNGIAATSIQEIVASAEASVGSFYARFPDKESFVAAFYERFYEYSAKRAGEGASLNHLGAADLVRAWVETRLAYYLERRLLIRAVLMHTRANPDPHFRAAASRFAASTLSRIQRLLLARGREIGHPRPERAVLHALTMIEATLKDVVLFRERRSPALAVTDDELRSELTRAALAYLEVID